MNLAQIKNAVLPSDTAELLSKIRNYRLNMTLTTDPKLRIGQASMRHTAGAAICKLVWQLGVRDIFEIGVCAGIGASYMLAGAVRSKGVRYRGLEGDPARIKLAKETLYKMFGLTVDWDIIEGHFDDTFDSAVDALSPLEFVYLDGRHKEEPTVYMFEQCVAAMPAGGWILADDLDWSAGMRAAARRIRRHRRIERFDSYAGKELFRIKDAWS